jgi:hypothetical protein
MAAGVLVLLVAISTVAACNENSASDGAASTADDAGLEEPAGAESDAPLADGDASVVRSGAPGEGAPPDPELQVIDRKIVQSTSIDVEVTDVARSFQEVLRIADVEAGHVVSSSLTNIDDEQAGDVTLRVPHDRYRDVLTQLRLMGDVVSEQSDGNDVTEEFTDLQARLRTLEATEQRYLDLLAQANDINEILAVQDRLDGVRGQVEQVQGRINLLNGLTEMSTITVHIRLPEGGIGSGGGPNPLHAAEAAWHASVQALRGVTAAVVVVAVFSWWLVPLVLAVVLAARWWSRRSQERVAPPVG